MRIAAAAQMKEIDRRAIEERGIPSPILMEAAARHVAAEAATFPEGRILQEEQKITAQIAVFCGPGNNGGDGVAAARFLAEQGKQVRAFLAGKREKLTPDTQLMEERLKEAGLLLEDWTGSDEQKEWCAKADLILDALLGIGL